MCLKTTLSSRRRVRLLKQKSSYLSDGDLTDSNDEYLLAATLNKIEVVESSDDLSNAAEEAAKSAVKLSFADEIISNKEI